MDEETELLRLRAKAKLRLRSQQQEPPVEAPVSAQPQPSQSPQSFTGQRFPLAAQGIKQAQEGNVVAGGINLANQATNEVLRPFALADQFLRTNETINPSGFPVGKAVANVAGIIPRAIAGEGNYIPGVGTIPSLYDMGKSVVDATGVPNLLNSLFPVSDKTGSEIAQAMDVMNRNVSMVTMPQAGVKAFKEAGAIKQNISANRNAKQIAKAQAEIKKVAPPTPKELNYDKLLDQATPYIAKQLKETPIEARSDVSPIRQATDVVAQAKSNLWNEKIAPVVEKYGAETIDGGLIAKSIREGLTDYTKNHDPISAKRIESYAASFEGKQIPISQASKYITELNARTSAYQKAPAVQKTLIENASPNILSEISAVDALREQVYSRLDNLGAPEIRGLKKDYGSLMQVHKALERNIVKAEKGTQSRSFYGRPFGTAVAAGATIEGMIHSPKTTAVAGTIGLLRKYMTERDKPNPTIERAFGRLEKSKEPQSKAIDIKNFTVTPEFYAEANRLGVRIDERQNVKGGKAMPLFTDNKTGSTFTINAGETLSDAVARVRKKNTQPRMTWQEALAAQERRGSNK